MESCGSVEERVLAIGVVFSMLPLSTHYSVTLVFFRAVGSDTPSEELGITV